MAYDPAWKEKITVTKMDVARRQLKTAIELWFEERDPISIHLLAFSSHEIIHRLFRAKGLKNLMFDSTIIKEEYRSEYSKMLKEDAAFMKHADRDIDGTLEFVLGRNFLFILMSVIGIQKMGETLSHEETIFLFWCRVYYPDWFTIKEGSKDVIPNNQLAQLRSVTKYEFFQNSLLRLRQVSQKH
jgi:hypothetical protein